MGPGRGAGLRRRAGAELRRSAEVEILERLNSAPPDVPALDYDALTTLNVSATQELARQVAAVQARLRQQTARADQAEAPVSGFEQQLRALESSGEQARR